MSNTPSKYILRQAKYHLNVVLKLKVNKRLHIGTHGLI
jgi:hypothetical protein